MTYFSFLIKHLVTKTYWVLEEKLPAFSFAKPHGKAYCPGYLAPGERFKSHSLAGGWFGPRTGLEPVERRDIARPAGKVTLVPLYSSPVPNKYIMQTELW